MQRLKELDAKTSSPEPSVKDNLQCAAHNAEDVNEGSHGTNGGSHDAKEGLHDSCGPMPVIITDEAQSNKDHKNDDVKMQENRTDIEQNVTNGNTDLDGQELENDGQDTSPSTPLPAVSNSIGSGLYIVGMHRKMVRINCDCIGIIILFM